MDRYEEALERAKKAVKEGMVSQSFVDDIFGTQERTDERITNCIVELLRKTHLSYFFDMGTTFVECLAYIERMKAQKSLNISAASEWLREHVRRYINSEYNEFHKCVEYDGSIDKERLINDFEEAMQKEHKPAEWSKEDENALVYFHELISFGYTENFCDAQTAADMRKWLNTRLKSIRSHPSWKPSEYMLSLVKKVADGEMLTNMEQMAMGTLYNDLKKL